MNWVEIIDFVEQKLREQGRKSFRMAEGVCAYRNGNARCAVGWLIPDDMYYADLECNSVDDLMHSHMPFLTNFFESLTKRYGASDQGTIMDFLGKLQFIHDFVDIEEWPAKFQALREEYGAKV